MDTKAAGSFILKFACKNDPHIVAAIVEFLARNALSVSDTQQYGDSESGKFFMRLVAARSERSPSQDEIWSAFAKLALSYGMEWSIRDTNRPYRVLIMVSLFDHCLADILYRCRIGELPITISGIVSNHPVDAFAGHDLAGAPFHYLPVDKTNKESQERRLLQIVEESGTDLVVLARYMQVFTRDLSARLSGKAINIHHSFLPGFKGAKPYHQAHSYGVKVMGATAHYVTADLDEGPIIEQDVERISHFDSPESLIRKGRDIERRVLARAIRYHVDDRIFLNGRKTVVFPD